MRKKVLVMCLIVMCVLSNTLCVRNGLAKNQSNLHLYQGIPFYGTSRETVLQILMEKTGLPLEAFHEIFGGKSEAIKDFGYEWNLQVDFLESDTTLDRILLSSAQAARVMPDEFDERLRSDLLQFIDLDGQLTALYGEPNYRFFFTETRKKTYMFPNGTWDLEQMIGVCQDYGQFQSYSVWGNVALRIWVDFVNPRYADKPLLRVMLYYHQEIAPPPAASIVLFSPSQDD